jgi:hypothetical protein
MTSLNNDEKCNQIFSEFVLLKKSANGEIHDHCMLDFRMLNVNDYNQNKLSGVAKQTAFQNAAKPLLTLLKTPDEMEILAGARILPVHASCPSWGCEVCAKSEICVRLALSTQHLSE